MKKGHYLLLISFTEGEAKTQKNTPTYIQDVEYDDHGAQHKQDKVKNLRKYTNRDYLVNCADTKFLSCGVAKGLKGV